MKKFISAIIILIFVCNAYGSQAVIPDKQEKKLPSDWVRLALSDKDLVEAAHQSDSAQFELLLHKTSAVRKEQTIMLVRMIDGIKGTGQEDILNGYPTQTLMSYYRGDSTNKQFSMNLFSALKDCAADQDSDIKKILKTCNTLPTKDKDPDIQEIIKVCVASLEKNKGFDIREMIKASARLSRINVSSSPGNATWFSPLFFAIRSKNYLSLELFLEETHDHSTELLLPHEREYSQEYYGHIADKTAVSIMHLFIKHGLSTIVEKIYLPALLLQQNSLEGVESSIKRIFQEKKIAINKVMCNGVHLLFCLMASNKNDLLKDLLTIDDVDLGCVDSLGNTLLHYAMKIMFEPITKTNTDEVFFYVVSERDSLIETLVQAFINKKISIFTKNKAGEQFFSVILSQVASDYPDQSSSFHLSLIDVLEEAVRNQKAPGQISLVKKLNDLLRNLERPGTCESYNQIKIKPKDLDVESLQKLSKTHYTKKSILSTLGGLTKKVALFGMGGVIIMGLFFYLYDYDKHFRTNYVV